MKKEKTLKEGYSILELDLSNPELEHQEKKYHPNIGQVNKQDKQDKITGCYLETLGNLQSFAYSLDNEHQGYQLDDILDDIKVNECFAKPLFDSIDAMLKPSIKQYSLKKHLEVLGNAIVDNPFEVRDYVTQVKKAQSGELQFEVSGDSDKLEYKMNVDAVNQIVVKYLKDKPSEVEINNSGLAVRFSVDDKGEVKLLENFVLNDNQAMQVFEAYKPFLLQLKKSSLDYLHEHPVLCKKFDDEKQYAEVTDLQVQTQMQY